MNLVDHFVPLGYAVYGFDHIGHGKSEGPRVYVNRFGDFIETLKIYGNLVREWQAGCPFFLIGHSMGGLISSSYLLEPPAFLSGAVLSGPAVKAPETLSRLTLIMGKVLSALTPRLGLVTLEAAGVSRDPDVVRAYESDPLVYRGKLTARLASELISEMERITREAFRITTPIIIVQGRKDRLVDPAGAQCLYDAAASSDKMIQLYDDLYHEVFNEPEHARVLGDVEAWISARLDPREQPAKAGPP
jgi:alpha-beta hydrolase superfamily lysophospholipase